MARFGEGRPPNPRRGLARTDSLGPGCCDAGLRLLRQSSRGTAEDPHTAHATTDLCRRVGGHRTDDETEVVIRARVSSCGSSRCEEPLVFTRIMSDSNRSLRLLFIATVVALVNITFWHSAVESGHYAGDVSQLPDNSTLATHYGYRSGGLHSGVGLVTQDGLWGNEFDEKYKDEDVKILGFTDKNYLPIAKFWYMRLTALGYKEHYIVAHDEVSYNAVKDDYRAIACIIQNPDYARPVKGLWQQIMSARLHLTVDMLRNGTHLLITDVDNVFSRYVPLSGFLEEGYDVYHAFEMRYPLNIFHQFGFVVCSGHQFIRSSPAALRFMDLVMNRCSNEKCDDQVSASPSL